MIKTDSEKISAKKCYRLTPFRIMALATVFIGQQGQKQRLAENSAVILVTDEGHGARARVRAGDRGGGIREKALVL